jgi:hypothetical protein
MMKLVKGLILTMYLIVYGYSVHKTMVEPEKVVWGYICVLVCLILAIWALGAFVKSQEKPREDN